MMCMKFLSQMRSLAEIGTHFSNTGFPGVGKKKPFPIVQHLSCVRHIWRLFSVALLSHHLCSRVPITIFALNQLINDYSLDKQGKQGKQGWLNGFAFFHYMSTLRKYSIVDRPICKPNQTRRFILPWRLLATITHMSEHFKCGLLAVFTVISLGVDGKL